MVVEVYMSNDQNGALMDRNKVSYSSSKTHNQEFFPSTRFNIPYFFSPQNSTHLDSINEIDCSVDENPHDHLWKYCHVSLRHRAFKITKQSRV